MKYLLAYKGFCKFSKEWEVETDQQDLQNLVIKLRKGLGLISSNTMQLEQHDSYEGYFGEVYRLSDACFGNVVAEPISIIGAGTAGDSFTFSLPVKYHTLPQYHVAYRGKILQCVLVNEIIYRELKDIGIAS